MKVRTLLALTFFVPLSAAAQESASFLKLGVGARAMGMGGAYTAVADDVNAMYWNPAGLASLTQRSIGATHADLFANTRYDFFGYAQPTRFGTLGASAAYLSQAPLSGRSDTGAPMGNYDAADTAVNLSYAAAISAVPGLGLGGTMKYISSSIADASAQGYAFDVGIRYAPPAASGFGGAAFGLTIQNIGPGMKFLNQTAPLPMTIAGGVAYLLPFGFLLAADYKYRPYDHPGEASFGAEYQLLTSLALRAGYDSGSVLSDGVSGFSALSGFTAGLGIKCHGYSVDYSVAPMGELGSAQRISLAALF